MQLKEISIKKIKENPWNPNEMTETQLKHLKKEYKRVGYLQPILVRPKGKNYQIVDGEHRFKAYKKLDKKKIPVIVKKMNDKTAKTTTLNLNEIKGENNPIKYAELLKELQKEYTEEQLTNILDKTENDIESYMLLLDLPEELEDEEDLNGVTENATYTLSLTPEQEKQFMRAIRKTDNQVLEEAILIICDAYLEGND